MHTASAVKHPFLPEDSVLLSDEPEQVDMFPHVHRKDEETEQPQGQSVSQGQPQGQSSKLRFVTVLDVVRYMFWGLS